MRPSRRRRSFATVLAAVVLVGGAGVRAHAVAPAAEAPVPPGSAPDRTEEMLGKMRAAVEDIAGLYGNPTFVQVFTNNRAMADELRERLRTTDELRAIRAEVAGLAARRDSLANEVALKEQEVKRLNERLARQRAALDSVAGAIAATNRAVEGTVP